MLQSLPSDGVLDDDDEDEDEGAGASGACCTDDSQKGRKAEYGTSESSRLVFMSSSLIGG